MPISFSQFPPKAPRPSTPNLWLWLGVLPVWQLIGAGLTFWHEIPSLQTDPWLFWSVALGVPSLLWFAAVLTFGMLHHCQHSAADGWDEAREAHRIRLLGQGRRSLQILAGSVHTAFCPADQDGAIAPLAAVLANRHAAQFGPDLQDPSQDNRDEAAVEAQALRVLQAELSTVLAKLALSLESLPECVPLALSLEIASDCSSGHRQRAWQQAWQDSGIRQQVTLLQVNGLNAVDRWLDQRINDQAVLMVVSVQMACSQTKAQWAVGLLLGNRLTQTTLLPCAYLHRPEQATGSATDELLVAANQALAWVPLEPKAIGHIWLTGIESPHQASLTAALARLELPAVPGPRLCSLDLSPGQAGAPASWLAIALATQHLEREPHAQFICSGSGSEAPLWCCVVMPTRTQ